MTAAQALTEQLNDIDAVQACGTLHLSAALAAAVQADRDTAATHLEEASALAARMDTEVGRDIHAAIRTARDAIGADPGDIMVWNLLGYLHRLDGDETAAHDAWSIGIEHTDPGAGTTTLHNLRVQSWLANVEACTGHTGQARERVARLTEAEPHNGYLKYRLTHVLAELGDAREGIRVLREAVQDGFLSAQLLQHDELLGLSSLVDLVEYREVKRALQRNVKRAKDKYAPRT